MPKGSSDKVIITCAITGSIHTPTMSPYVPITPEQISDEAVAAAEAGAAIVHIHVRDPQTGQPKPDLSLYHQVVDKIRSQSDVIVNITTGGNLYMTPEERIRVIPELKPELATLNMGTMNFSLHPIVGKIKEWKYAWEKPYLEGTKNIFFKNIFPDIEYFAKTMYENGTKPELECYDVAQMYNAKQLVSEGKLKTPLHMQFVMGILGGVGASVEDLVHLKGTGDRLFGQDGYTWSVAAAGKNQFPMCMTAASLGGQVRVGLEDSLYLKRGVLANSNAAQVEKVKSLVYEVTGREAATPDEAREIIGIEKRVKVTL